MSGAFQQKLPSPKDLFLLTPLVKSEPLSRLLRSSTPRDVYLKLDNLQRSGSYKDRGMANLLWQSRLSILNDSTTNVKQCITRIVCSSGGNAGLAAATVAQDLQMHCTVVIPKTTKPLVIEKLKALQADVIVTGENWNEADAVARSMVQGDTNNTTIYVPPYDHPLLWTGISSLVDEIYSTESLVDNPPSAIILSVGGGGLLCGVLEGLEAIFDAKCSDQNDLLMPNILCAETDGAASFSVTWNSGKVQSLEQITSIATSLGALTVTSAALDRAQRYERRHADGNHSSGTVSSVICTDAEAVDACLQFARDHRMLVEPACGAALAVLYSDRLRNQYFGKESTPQGPVVIEICGGSGVNMELLLLWKENVLQNSI